MYLHTQSNQANTERLMLLYKDIGEVIVQSKNFFNSEFKAVTKQISYKDLNWFSLILDDLRYLQIKSHGLIMPYVSYKVYLATHYITNNEGVLLLVFFSAPHGYLYRPRKADSSPPRRIRMTNVFQIDRPAASFSLILYFNQLNFPFLVLLL